MHRSRGTTDWPDVSASDELIAPELFIMLRRFSVMSCYAAPYFFTASLALGTTLWSRTGAADAATPEANQQILARGRDLRSSEGPLVLPVSGHRFGRSHD
jgi:hypothetical protein